MPRAELTGLFDMMRSMPPAQSIVEMRATMEVSADFINANPPSVAGVEAGVEIGGAVRADIIVPPGTPPFPVVIYLHGGGWSIGSPATHRKLARQLCAGAGVVVVNVDYRLAPEHPFPTPLDDCVAAARWTRANVKTFGGDPALLAIGGDSAGGNLSAAVINDLRDDIQFRAALLIYGAFDLLASRRDYDKWAPEEDPVLPKRSMDMMLAAYLTGGASTDDARVSPIHADLRHFPPACLLCGTWDPLLGDSRALHAKLKGLGRESVLHEYEAMPHAFVQLPCTEADAALATGCEFLRMKLR
ncbi:MAG: alpha/beta hydrolase [Deltaproteobacteria bacterium]|nr:alpha/beta hydrolase [Deltaproteobacteria bacterium]MBI3388793.1 alpha/beta hydrolase [Deltaproteobacteria bacterium]